MAKSKSNLSWKIGFFVIPMALIIFIGAMVLYMGSTTNSDKTNQTTITNPDGTSKTTVYTKVSDFGEYSDWAQTNLNNGVSMCAVQNKLAETDLNVSRVADCNTSVNCITRASLLGTTSTTSCTKQ